MRRATKKGNVTVEAAIVLPVFILAVLSLAWCMDVSCAREGIFHIMTDEARGTAIESYKAGTALPLSGKTEQRVRDEIELTDTYRVSSVRKLRDNVLKISSTGTVKNSMPVKVTRDIVYDCDIMFRAFLPEDNSGDIFSFDDMEKDEDGRTVWVFPVAGERYHEEECPYIAVDARQMLLTDNIRRRYEPCSLCSPGAMPNGSLIYCFPNAGEVYHLGNCTQVDRYVVSMSVTEAEEKGYSPCIKCGGGI